MVTATTKTSPGGRQPETSSYDYEVIVIGAGVAGINQIKRLLDLGVHATVLDANEDLGGTWYNNRYPGCRFDSESYTYCFNFSQEVLDEWHWKERFSPQPETLKYLNFVVDKLGLRDHMQFNCRVEAMAFDEERDTWNLSLSDGRALSSRFIITALGPFSTPTLPKIEGIEDFKGLSFHSADWPHEPLDLRGKRVGIIGTGATAIQIIPLVAEEASQLTVFQRRPNWSAPLNNSPISVDEMNRIRANYDEIFEACSKSLGAFEHTFDPRSFYDVTPEERRELWDRLYDGPGFGIQLANFAEILGDVEANKEISAYIADRIRQRVDDPEVAEKLIPKDHGFGVQRVPLETGYFEAYNRDNVELVDVSETPIEQITPSGLRTSTREFDLDVLVYATGWDSFTGAYDRVEITGLGGEKLKDNWAQGPQTCLGMLVHGFPNMAMLGGPQCAAANFPRGSEASVEWLIPLFQHMRDHGHTRFNVTKAAQQEFLDEVKAGFQASPFGQIKGWQTGYNSNVEGHEYGNPRYNVYPLGFVEMGVRLERAAEGGYPVLDFT